MACEVGYLRLRLSFDAVQGQARLLLERLQMLGDVTGLGSGEWALAARRAEECEIRAQHVSMLKGYNIRRSSFGLLENR